MNDLIERSAVIDLIDKYTQDMSTDYWTANYGIPSGVFEDEIMELPSAQPEQIWILCDEKMPEEHEWIGTKKFGTTISDEVYVTFENEKGERFCKHMTFQNGELSRYDKTYMDAWYKDYKPIAWMPLPEPYMRCEQNDSISD